MKSLLIAIISTLLTSNALLAETTVHDCYVISSRTLRCSSNIGDSFVTFKISAAEERKIDKITDRLIANNKKQLELLKKSEELKLIIRELDFQKELLSFDQKIAKVYNPNITQNPNIESLDNQIKPLDDKRSRYEADLARYKIEHGKLQRDRDGYGNKRKR